VCVWGILALIWVGWSKGEGEMRGFTGVQHKERGVLLEYNVLGARGLREQPVGTWGFTGNNTRNEEEVPYGTTSGGGGFARTTGRDVGVY
jgi:hypothetical protein